MFPFNKTEQKEENPVDVQVEVRAIVHFTPATVFVYECESEPYFDRMTSAIDLKDKDGNYVGISGTLMSIVIPKGKTVDQVLGEYEILNLGLPIVRKTGYKEI